MILKLCWETSCGFIKAILPASKPMLTRALKNTSGRPFTFSLSEFCSKICCGGFACLWTKIVWLVFSNSWQIKGHLNVACFSGVLDCLLWCVLRSPGQCYIIFTLLVDYWNLCGKVEENEMSREQNESWFQHVFLKYFWYFSQLAGNKHH